MSGDSVPDVRAALEQFVTEYQAPVLLAVRLAAISISEPGPRRRCDS